MNPTASTHPPNDPLGGAVAWLTNPAIRQRPYYLLRCQPGETRTVVATLFEHCASATLTATGGSAAHAATEHLGRPTQALPRVLYSTERGERRPVADLSMGTDKPIILVGAHRLPRDLAGDLFATGSPAVLILEDLPEPGSFAANRPPDSDTTQRRGHRIIRAVGTGYVLNTDADGIAQIVAISPGAGDPVARGTVFRAVPTDHGP